MNLLSILTPTNLAHEREQFFTKKNYHPVFSYAWQSQDAGPNALTRSTTSQTPKSQLVQAIFTQNHDAIVKKAQEFFEMTSWEYVARAKKIVSQPPNRGPDQYADQKVTELKQVFINALEFFELGGKYDVKIVDSHGFNVRPVPKQHEILISTHIDFQFFDVRSQACHEISHIIRYENGKHNQIKPSRNALPTEEGLAAYLQDTCALDNGSVFQHASEYLASQIGLSGSLRDIYDFFRDHGFNPELAWQRASRHKFGFVETRAPGDILKPAMYFAHAQSIGALSSQEKIRLFVGKISLRDLAQHPVYEGVIKQERIREFFNFKD